jgi:hypothetical protein
MFGGSTWDFGLVAETVGLVDALSPIVSSAVAAAGIRRRLVGAILNRKCLLVFSSSLLYVS